MSVGVLVFLAVCAGGFWGSYGLRLAVMGGVVWCDVYECGVCECGVCERVSWECACVHGVHWRMLSLVGAHGGDDEANCKSSRPTAASPSAAHGLVPGAACPKQAQAATNATMHHNHTRVVDTSTRPTEL